jgi:hypothetical protein
MTIIGINPLGTTTLYGMTTSLNSIVEDKEAASSTVATTITTLSASSINKNVNIYYANKYVDSLSDTQIVRCIEQIEEQENSMNKLLIKRG